MINAVMIVCNRLRLTKQSIDSFLNNSRLDWKLTLVDDASDKDTVRLLNYYLEAYPKKINRLRFDRSQRIIGKLKNLGIKHSEKTWGRGDALYVSDNDVFFTPEWDVKMMRALLASDGDQKPIFKLLGPYRNTYYQPIDVYTLIGDSMKIHVSTIKEIQGLGHLMRWETWDKYGPYHAKLKGTCQGEDAFFSLSITRDGFRIGCVQPNVVYHCGVTTTEGRDTGAFEVMEQIPNVLME